jgi:hypothetical protein
MRRPLCSVEEYVVPSAVGSENSGAFEAEAPRIAKGLASTIAMMASTILVFTFDFRRPITNHLH